MPVGEAAKGGFSLEAREEELRDVIRKHSGRSGSVIPVLQEVQEAFGYLPEAAVRWVAERLDIPESRFFGVATFYGQFHLKPRGRNVISACCGAACNVKGSERILNAVRRELGLSEGQDTTEDVQFTAEKVNCVGSCSIAPVVIINKETYGRTTSEKILREVKALRRGRPSDER